MKEQSESLHARLTWKDLLRLDVCSRSHPHPPQPADRTAHQCLICDPGALCEPSGWDHHVIRVHLASNTRTFVNRALTLKYALTRVSCSLHRCITNVGVNTYGCKRPCCMCQGSTMITESQIVLPCTAFPREQSSLTLCSRSNIPSYSAPFPQDLAQGLGKIAITPALVLRP